MTPDMAAWARDECPLVDGRRSTERFVNHFTAKTGRDATKLDWERTWKNWLLKDQQDAERARPKKTKDEQVIDVLEMGRLLQESEDRKELSA
ncbi:hypothetical protein [Humibacter sp.]|uniref:hypothetical protein n=1 Tax=Humibacter sp. TaxID=1940291 RepID=UPI003F7DCA14